MGGIKYALPLISGSTLALPVRVKYIVGHIYHAQRRAAVLPGHPLFALTACRRHIPEHRDIPSVICRIYPRRGSMMMFNQALITGKGQAARHQHGVVRLVHEWAKPGVAAVKVVANSVCHRLKLGSREFR